MRTLYPSIEPYKTGFLEVGEGHRIYWEESGNPNGLPILFLHGGPGLGTRPHNRCFFHPEKYRIILFDQRGCGKSIPFLSLENNTTEHLIKDIEKLRLHLQVDKWVLFGGSWGSTLALAYAIQYPQSVSRFILRGVFLCRPKEIDWFHRMGASFIFPDFWEDYIEAIPSQERENLIEAFYNRLIGKDLNQRNDAAKAWAMWGGRTYKLITEEIILDNVSVKDFYPSALIECHYLYYFGFFKTKNWILENLSKVNHLPCTILQGRYDILCPMQSAWELHKAWPNSKLKIISDAGHSSSEPRTLDMLIQVTDALVGQI